MADVFVFEDSGSGGRRRFVGLAVALAVVAGAGLLWWVGRAPGAAIKYSCVYVGGGSAAEREAQDDYCERRAVDAARRGAAPDWAPTDPRAEQLDRALEQALCRFDGGRVDCLGATSGQRRKADGADVELIRRTMIGAGFPDPVVRLTGRKDPAPDGAVAFATLVNNPLNPAETACLVGYAKAAEHPEQNLVGKLPGGRCLEK
ncbi:hypothetical protein ACQP2F_05870 [Actinoplanes sp. CA-030573]|uniref:hypothetical protein n=1 Tax=Actinoplanes sp. CA-030573 TaxID=3239898 RepID=UPI003D8C3A5F